MATYKNTFTGFMAPYADVVTKEGVGFSVDFADLTHFRLKFDFPADALDVPAEALTVKLPELAAPLQFTTTLSVQAPDFAFVWQFITEPATLTLGQPMTLQLDPSISFVNFGHTQGTVDFNISFSPFNFSYDLSGVIFEAPIDMPLTNGTIPVAVELDIKIIDGFTLPIYVNGLPMNTSLKADKVLKDFIFTELAFSDGLHIEDFRRPFNSTSLTGAIHFQDKAGEINANLPFSSYINPDGALLGYFTNNANINDAAVDGKHLTGSWQCENLELSIEPSATITGACVDSFLIPTYTSISGEVNLTAK